MDPTSFLVLPVALFAGSCLAAPVTNGKEYPCLQPACEGDDEAVYAIYKNESYCCHGGDAIFFTISGPGFEYVKMFYAHNASGGEEDDSGDATDGGVTEGAIAKRSADGDSNANDGNNNSTYPITRKCLCKTVSSLTDTMGDAIRDAKDAFDQLFGVDSSDLDI